MSTARADVGLIGLEVMGRNLILNMADHGFKVAVHNRSVGKVKPFLDENPPSVLGPGGELIGFWQPEDEAERLRLFVQAIKRPRRIILLVKAGEPTDSTISKLVPLLEPGDLIIDGGNAEWNDTVRREKALAEPGLLFCGSGVSGGETGARFGPSLMPGGRPEAWEMLKPVWTAIAAKVDAATGRPIEGAAPGKPVSGGVPCTTYIGPGGAGHYVKMVHNGIEYGDMQLICEAYHFMRDVLGMSVEQMSRTFAQWNTGDLDSFLIEITADILQQKDARTGKPFVDIVLDAAGQKGTGKWTIGSALDLGVPAATMAEAVFARNMSALKAERVSASKVLQGPQGGGSPIEAADWVACVRDALYCSKICSYAQGFALMSAASRASGWNLKLGEIASIFRGGCIIRARFLQKITEAYTRRPDLPNLLLDEYFAGTVNRLQTNWRSVVARAALRGVPVPAFASALSYYDSYRSERLPANLLQAQRDYFGAHTYERVDEQRGVFFHLDWPEKGRPELKA
ncbi:MAG: NADP-dependent phosphogluconate dehydrogenase [Planctomycetota bacterium]|nr:NADP-dependent phosphogluconate dehydrogenase [Planctomycetota bacterium]